MSSRSISSSTRALVELTLFLLFLPSSILEGIVTVVLGLACIFILPNTPATAKRLSQVERDALVYRLESEKGAKDDSDQISVGRALVMAVSDIKTWLMCGILFFTYVYVLPLSALDRGLPEISTRRADLSSSSHLQCCCRHQLLPLGRWNSRILQEHHLLLDCS